MLKNPVPIHSDLSQTSTILFNSLLAANSIVKPSGEGSAAPHSFIRVRQKVTPVKRKQNTRILKYKLLGGVSVGFFTRKLSEIHVGNLGLKLTISMNLCEIL